MLRQPSLVLTTFLGWIGLEFLAFALAVYFFGWMGTIALGLLTTLVGAGILRNVGLGASRHIRATLSGRSAPEGKMLDGVLSAIGGILLIAPGFLSDIAGLALAAPSIRQWLARRLIKHAGSKKTGNSKIIELDTGDWSRGDNSRPPNSEQITHAKF